MEVELASCGNPDHFQNPNRPMWGCESNHNIKVGSLEEASLVCSKFIERNNLGGGNWIGGKVLEKNEYIAQISITGKIMSPEPETGNRKEGMTKAKKELIAIGDVPEYMEKAGLELARAYFEENHLNPFTCFEAILYENNPELEYHWYKAEKEANKILLSDSQYVNSGIYLTYIEADN